ncbi:hypothetical protein PVAND_001823 [Polypedilum vanderplanki]|uniref:Uncharacterized protein n=1 Tax=Polypedilum vanderplanki TaxID=319348 RepID=A0A9J6BPI4_POLVA|nr:hypothetical protein PVAND_001823 [Polypedilum vanderplanki]
METIGDHHSQAEIFQNDSIAFGVYLEEFKTLLLSEEDKLIKLESRRKKIESDMMNIEEEIQKEKKNFINIMTGIISERQSILNSFVILKDVIESSQENEIVDELISKSKHVIQNMNTDSCLIEIENGEDKTNVIDIRESSENYYLNSMRKFLAEKEYNKKLTQDKTHI